MAYIYIFFASRDQAVTRRFDGRMQRLWQSAALFPVEKMFLLIFDMTPASTRVSHVGASLEHTGLTRRCLSRFEQMAVWGTARGVPAVTGPGIQCSVRPCTPSRPREIIGPRVTEPWRAHFCSPAGSILFPGILEMSLGNQTFSVGMGTQARREQICPPALPHS